MSTLHDTLTKFNWQPQPATQRLVDHLLTDFLGRNPVAAVLAAKMTADTGTRFRDWVDHIVAPSNAVSAARLNEVGYKKEKIGDAEHFTCDLGIFPPIRLGADETTRVAIKVDSISDYLGAHQLSRAEVHGDPGTRVRMACVAREDTAELWIVERHGDRSYTTGPADPAKALAAMKHLEALCTRDRNFDNCADGFAEANRLVDAAIKDLGTDWTCDLFFEAERRYWMRRNHAAQVQYARQRRLGLGWANHDHHTYRSSREHFTSLIALWEKLGFRARECFYAGHEAGWGAQVMEQLATGITTFNDVDMSPEELLGDFAHEGFTEQRPSLGTVGLWVGLHGEAILQAGMHHLECQFDFHALVDQLERTAEVHTMAPFTTFPYLRQAFTEGERWRVEGRRVTALLNKGFITVEQAAQFRSYGAIGSHLENLERNDGFKGFNQQGVSDIIARTDPRRLASARK